MALSNPSTALSHLRICDFTGQLAGAGATKFLAAFGAQVIRIEDPVTEGRWDILRGMAPYTDERRGINLSGAYNNHNVEKLGITLNLRTARGKELLRDLIAISGVVTENFSAGVLDNWGFSYEAMKLIRPDLIYVSNCGFGHKGPYVKYKTWGPIVQAVSGLTFSSGLPGMPPAGWGYSYLDHTGAYYMAIAILMALYHRQRTGEGQWVDLACVEAGATLNGPAMLDFTANGRPLRRQGRPHSNHNDSPAMAPHNIYPAEGEDNWVAIVCRDDTDWRALAAIIAEPWSSDPSLTSAAGRLAAEGTLDARVSGWTAARDRFAIAAQLQATNIPAAVVQRPQERIDNDPNTAAWGLWPTIAHQEMGLVRVDGIPVHLSGTDWSMTDGAPCLGEDNEYVYGELLGLSGQAIAALREEKVI